MAFAYKRSITVDHTKVPNTDQSNFPFVVAITDATLAVVGSGGHVQNSSGHDIGFFSDSALTTALFWEIERYISTTGELIAWVRLPTCATATDTVIYMGYGDAAKTTFQSTVATVWSAYSAVWHLGNGTTLSGTDSLGSNNATLNSVTASSAGKLGGGASYAGTSHLSLGTNIVTILNGSFTVEFQVKVNTSINTTIWGRKGDGHSRVLVYNTNVAGKISTVQETVATIQSATFTTGSLQHVCWTYDNTGHISALYLNGALQSSVSYTFTGNGANNTGWAQLDNLLVGVVDEGRISNAVKSADWVASSFNAQNHLVSAFFTLGAETSTSGISPAWAAGSNQYIGHSIL